VGFSKVLRLASSIPVAVAARRRTAVTWGPGLPQRRNTPGITGSQSVWGRAGSEPNTGIFAYRPRTRVYRDHARRMQANLSEPEHEGQFFVEDDDRSVRRPPDAQHQQTSLEPPCVFRRVRAEFTAALAGADGAGVTTRSKLGYCLGGGPGSPNSRPGDGYLCSGSQAVPHRRRD